jgi:phosphatidylglycerol lysyltransferase
VPGGIGVFEALVLLLSPGAAEGAALFAALLVFRVVYYLLPLGFAGVLLLRETWGAQPASSIPVRLSRTFTVLAPHLLAGVAFVSGGLLFLTGALPRAGSRLALLTSLFPSGLVDASHFLASIVGTALLIVAWGLERGVRLAYRVSVALFGSGILLALGRALDASVAIFLAAALAVLLLSRRSFARVPSPGPAALRATWVFGVGAALLTSVWLGLVGNRWKAAGGETWWRFTLFGGAPAYVRAGAGAVVSLLLFGLVRLFLLGRPERAEEAHAPHRSRTQRAGTPGAPSRPAS